MRLLILKGVGEQKRNIILNKSCLALSSLRSNQVDHMLSLRHCADVVPFSGNLESKDGKQISRQLQIGMKATNGDNRLSQEAG